MKTFLCCVLSSVATASAVYFFIKQSTKKKSRNFKPTTHDASLIQEQLSRNISFLGQDKMEKLAGSFVVIVGLGGVGSHAAHMLARSGVGKIRLIDFDQVSLSSLNRHSVAKLSDVGTTKVDCLKKHLLDIVPWVEIEACNELFNKENAVNLLKGNPDLVLDCIDNIDTKVDLLHFCYVNNIQIFSSMGAGAKIDPTKILIADISETTEDPLARATRKKLKEKGIKSGIKVIFSTEKPGAAKLLPFPEDFVEDRTEFSILPDFRVRILPVIGTLPAIFGCMMASYSLCLLADWKVDTLAVKNRKATYMRVHRELTVIEDKQFNSTLEMTVSDVGYVLDEVWASKSVLSGVRVKNALVRWNLNLPPSKDNLICLTKQEAKEHLNGKKYSQSLRDYVESKLAEERIF